MNALALQLPAHPEPTLQLLHALPLIACLLSILNVFGVLVLSAPFPPSSRRENRPCIAPVLLLAWLCMFLSRIEASLF